MIQLQSTMASLPLVYNYTAVFEAIDPTDGSTVAGVEITDPSVYGIDLSGESQDQQPVGPFILVPGPEA